MDPDDLATLVDSDEELARLNYEIDAAKTEIDICIVRHRAPKFGGINNIVISTQSSFSATVAAVLAAFIQKLPKKMVTAWAISVAVWLMVMFFVSWHSYRLYTLGRRCKDGYRRTILIWAIDLFAVLVLVMFSALMHLTLTGYARSLHPSAPTLAPVSAPKSMQSILY